MSDQLLVATKIKKTIEYIEKIICNYPKIEYVLKNRIEDKLYGLLELVYKANIHKDVFYMKEIIINIRMIDYYIKISLEKEILSFKKYEKIGEYLLDINKMINSWIKYEKNK